MASAARLPGIAFETVPGSVGGEVLPRMDIAVFVGFAACGPVHRPVAVESVAAFQRIFGADPALARDVAAGDILRAGLGPSVRAFFSNGGVRCWVVRVARTLALEARYHGVGEDELDEVLRADLASARRFPISGVLEAGGDGTLRPAIAQARSLGAWADPLTVAARAERTPFLGAVTASAATGQFSLTADRILRIGDLLEFGVPGETLAYAEVLGAQAQAFDARWIGEFTLLDDLDAQVTVKGAAFTGLAHLDGAAGVLSFLGDAPGSAAAGDWIALGLPYDQAWFLVEGGGGRVLRGRAWSWRAGAPLAIPQRVARVTLGMSVGGARAEGVGLTRDHAAAWWSFKADDNSPDPGRFPLAAEGGLPDAWLPLGLAGRYSQPLPPLPEARTELERDGLSRFDAQIFLDPDLATVRAPRLALEAERIRDIDGRPLFGIHAALGIGGDSTGFNEPSLIAVPDAAQPGWSPRAAEIVPEAIIDAPPPAHWFGHRGPCAVSDPGANLDGPDWSRFLDCATRVLATPMFLRLSDQQHTGPLLLRWSASDPGAAYVLESATRADFKDAREIWTGDETEHEVVLAREGFAYFRLRAQIGDEFSLPDAVGFAVHETAWDALAPDPGAAVLTAVHRSLLRLAAGSGDYFALLSLPRSFHTLDAVAHSRRLMRRREGFGDYDQLDFNERRALSYGALYHPWIVSTAVGSETRDLIIAPPDGAVAGLFAKRAASRGAWIAPCNEELRDIVALQPTVPETDWFALDGARVNLVRKRADDFRILDADTLSDEPEWRQVNVRRLMSLIRRVALRRGAAYMFEPNGPVLRRAIERGFGQTLDHLFERGAFAGRTTQEAYRLVTDVTAGDGARVVVEIAVAPSQPLRFLTVRLAQAGERLTIAEER